MTLEINITSLGKTINVHINQMNTSSEFNDGVAKGIVAAVKKETEQYLDRGFAIAFSAPTGLLPK